MQGHVMMVKELVEDRSKYKVYGVYIENDTLAELVGACGRTLTFATYDAAADFAAGAATLTGVRHYVMGADILSGVPVTRLTSFEVIPL